MSPSTSQLQGKSPGNEVVSSLEGLRSGKGGGGAKIAGEEGGVLYIW